MGALVAALSKCDADVVPIVVRMLKTLAHRETGTLEIATPTKAVSARTLEDLRKQTDEPSNLAIGRQVSDIGPNRGKFSHASLENCTIVVEGHALGPFPWHHLDIVAARKNGPEEVAKELLRNLSGAYNFAVAFDKQLLIGRDPMGELPLHHGADRMLCAVATERKALWNVGLENTRSFPPGNLATLSPKGFAFKPIRTVTQPSQSKLGMNAAAKRLQKLLEQSVKRRMHGVERVAVAFSGGLDSSVVACLARKCGTSVDLISVGLEGQSELAHAKKAAEALDLPIMLEAFRVSDVEKALSRVVWLIEECDLMKTGVAIPLFWVAQIASNMGIQVLLAGQGADELFGGYRRYLTIYATRGVKKTAEAMYNDTVLSHETNFERDEPVCAYHKVDLRLPYADTDVVHFALSLPVGLKIDSASDGSRKRVLRQVALNLGIPTSVAEKPKKAIQFATGVDKALRSLAKSKGLTVHEYLEETFRRAYPNLEVKRNEHGGLL